MHIYLMDPASRVMRGPYAAKLSINVRGAVLKCLYFPSGGDEY